MAEKVIGEVSAKDVDVIQTKVAELNSAIDTLNEKYPKHLFTHSVVYDDAMNPSFHLMIEKTG